MINEKAHKDNLSKARQVKNDEFFTQLGDISKEVSQYRNQFRDKVVLCNCDDPYESNFFKYFCMNFNFLGLKKLIVTCYSNSFIANTEINLFENQEGFGSCGYKLEIAEMKDVNGDGAIDLRDVEYLLKKGKLKPVKLKGNGDFRSEECIELLKEADIVVTNPPFSLFREYVAQLVEYNKLFLIIGNKNAITYKEIFPLIKDNKLWIGAKPMGGSLWFTTPIGFANKSDKIVDGIKLTEVPCCWFTNMDVKKRHEELILYKEYSEDEYPKYDNYDAINVDKTTEIPCDYAGVMGVPITFMDKYNPEQFEILGCSSAIELFGISWNEFSDKFMELVNSGQTTTKGNLQKSKPCYINADGKAVIGYHRIFIRNKKIKSKHYK